MFTNLAKGEKRKIITFIVLIALCVTMIPIVSFGAGEDKDVTQYVDISQVKMKITKGTDSGDKEYILGVDTLPNFKKDQEISFYIDWGVKNANISHITSGAFFRVGLPQGVINFTSMAKKDLNGGLGTVQLIKSADGSEAYLEVIFNDNVKGAQELKDGWLRADGKVGNISDPEVTISFGSIVINVGATLTPTKPGIDYGNDVIPHYNWGDRKDLDFEKTLDSFSNYTGVAKFGMLVNYNNYESMLKSSSYSKLENVYITDLLPYGVTFKGPLYMYEYYPWVMEDGTVAAKDIWFDGYTWNTKMRMASFELDTNVNQNLDFDKFAKSVDEGKYAVWQNRGLVINYGDLPGTLKTVKTWGQIEEAVNSATQTETIYKRNPDNSIVYENGKKVVESTTQVAVKDEIKHATLDAYAKYYSGNKNADRNTYIDENKKAPLMSFQVQFDTDVKNANDKPVNVAYLNYSKEVWKSSSGAINYVDFSGGVSKGLPGDVELFKYDIEDNSLLEGVEFKLQKYNQSSKEYEDITAGNVGAGTYVTSSNGSFEIKGLPWGKYKFVETKQLEGYSEEIVWVEDESTQNGEFEISALTETKLFVTALNSEVAGELEPPKDPGKTYKTNQSVLGEEAKTGDLSNTMPILLVMLFAMMMVLVATVQSAQRKE